MRISSVFLGFFFAFFAFFGAGAATTASVCALIQKGGQAAQLPTTIMGPELACALARKNASF